MYHDLSIAKGIINNNNYAQFSHLQALHQQRKSLEPLAQLCGDAAQS